jgi:hypothetical protein
LKLINQARARTWRWALLIILLLIFALLPLLARLDVAGQHRALAGDIDVAPYPRSTIITDLAWAPAETIVRHGDGDNWPMTWADDDALYTAYGDDTGFDSEIERLSLGFARLIGGPQDFSAMNIPSPDEQVGFGQAGKKASGMLMVDGVLYMWVRNADKLGRQCQLAVSWDYARTWEWSDWRFAEFGYCTFINYGKNYAGARDDYVYTVTHDHPNAYEAGDHFVLMRVPKNRVADRAAYEFFVRVDEAGAPVWSADVDERGPVFTHVGNARRSGISYNAALGRYLWWQGLPVKNPRKEGGFGVYEAPEPWGPWRTVYYTKLWDVGPGETGSFPTKWMSADGATVHLVFSGADMLSVRRATLTVVSPPGDPPGSDAFVGDTRSYLPLVGAGR